MATEVAGIKAKLTLDTKDFAAGMDRAKKNLTEVADGAKKSAEELKKMAETREQIGHLTKQLENLTTKADLQRKKLADLRRQYDETFDEKKKLAIAEQVAKTEGALLALEKQTAATTKKVSELGESLQSTGSKADAFGQEAQSAVTKLGIAYAALGAAMVGIVAKSVEVAASFEQSMAKVRAISGATGKDFEALQNQALELGATTVFTASQAADAMGFLAMAGFDTTEIMAAMPGVLDLAAAGQMEIARTADIASNILTGFRIDASETGRVVDVMAKAMTSSNTNIEQLGEQQCPVAKKLAA